MRVKRAGMLAAAMCAVLVGCGGGSEPDDPAAPESAARTEATVPASPAGRAVIPGAEGEPATTVTPDPTPKGGGFIPEDVEFMQKMIAHHDQALVMTSLVPRNGSDTSVRLLAKRMEVSQQDEVRLMKDWLQKRNFKPEGSHAGHTSMPGMLTEAQLAKLEAAKGRQFDRLFLRFMTQHHEGALMMVQDLLNNGGGSEMEIGQFVQHVDSDQSIEIARMAELAKKL